MNWRTHNERQSQRAIAFYWVWRKTSDNTWGLNPKLILWLYKLVIRPLIPSYVSLATSLRLNGSPSGNGRYKCKGSPGAVSTTSPTAALKVLLNHINVCRRKRVELRDLVKQLMVR